MRPPLKYFLLYSLLIGLFFSCQSKQKTTPRITTRRDTINTKVNRNPFAFTLYDTTGKVVQPDKKLADAWKTFVQAVQAGDLSLIEKLSVNCIACENCDFKEDQPMSFKTFLKRYYQARFDGDMKSRMADSSKVTAHYDLANLHIYHDPCISGSKKRNEINIVEFFVKIIDRTEEHEGGDAAIAFIETAEGYKFCGYSIIG